MLEGQGGPSQVRMNLNQVKNPTHHQGLGPPWDLVDRRKRSGVRGRNFPPAPAAGIAASKPNSPARPSMSLRNESSRLGDRLALDGAAEAGLEAEFTEESVESAGERFWAPCGGKTGDGESIWKVSRAFVVSSSRKTLCLSCLVLLLFDRT